MCGIVGYTGPREAYPVIIKGLKRLEYRGYDSTGVALQNGGLKVYKKNGNFSTGRLVRVSPATATLTLTNLPVEKLP